MKAFERERNYLLELRSYQRLKEHNVSQIDGFSVPQLVNSNDQLLIIEMSIVSPPYLIDFGKVSIDTPPDFSEEVLADEEEQAAELFGENWPMSPIPHGASATFLRHLLPGPEAAKYPVPGNGHR